MTTTARLDHDPHNDGRTVEITYITIDRDQDDPRGPFEWCARQRRWFTRERVDIATTTHHTLRGRYEVRWVRRDTRGAFDYGPPRYRWTSADGGTPPPVGLVAALNEAIG